MNVSEVDHEIADRIHCPLCERAKKIIGREVPCYRHEYKKPSNEQLAKIREAARIAREYWEKNEN